MPYKKLKGADDAISQIVDGYMHFHEVVYPDQQELFHKLAFEQTPKAMFITCADSRVVPELITQSSDRKSTRLNSSHVRISYAVFCLKKKKMDNPLPATIKSVSISA